MHAARLAALTVLSFASLAGRARADAPEGRKYLLERVDDAAVVQLYADGFKDLPLRQKLLIWHLSRAAIAGRDIYYDQRYVNSLHMRAVVEAIVAHPEGVDPQTLAEVRRYTKLFWINSGPYHHLTARKFVLKCSPEALADALRTALKNRSGDDQARRKPRREAEPSTFAEWLATADDGEQRTILKLFGPDFFDPNSRPIVTNKSPGPGKDIIAASANNLYVGVTMKDLDGFTERYGLNSRLVKTEGMLVEEVYKAGGRYGKEITQIVGHLEEARKYAPEPTVRALDALITFYRTGETEDRRAYDIAWVKDKDATVDTINGFIEVYLDPRGVKGSWEALVSYVNPKKTGAIQKIAAEAQWFEDRMPWDKAYRKPDVRGITANAIDVVIETGDTGPVTPIGINLPNDPQIRETYGSKSVSLSNVIEAGDKATPTSFRKEFSWTPEEAARAETWSTLSAELLVNMHEVIGHASGRLSEKRKGLPRDAIKEFDSALEEGRADLVALYFMPDPKLAAIGLVAAGDQAEMARAAYESYTRNALVQLRRVREGTQIEEDHMRNRQMVVRWLIANTKAVEVRTREGKTYYVMTDPKAFREGVGRLLAEVQRIKSEGDYAAAKALFEAHGIHFEAKLRDEVLARVKSLDLPAVTAFVMPRLTPVKGPDGSITDVTIDYPMDLTTQMLEYSATK